jgi:hypothetical protein
LSDPSSNTDAATKQYVDAALSGGTGTIVVANVTATGEISANTVVANSANLGNTVDANYFVGDGLYLSNIPGANVTGQVGNALIAGTVYTNAQPNITSVGTLTSLVVTGNITSGNANLGNLVVANFFSGDGGYLSNLQIANASVANANYANFTGTVINAAQPNITSVGTLTSLAVSGNLTVGGNFTVNGTLTSINSTIVEIDDLAIVLANDATSSTLANGAGVIINGANANMLYISTSNAFVFSHKISADGGLLSNITGANVTGIVGNATHANVADLANSVAGANVSGQVGNALIAGTVYTNAQPNITSVGTLSSLDVTANITSGNANLGNLVTANFFSGSGNLLSNIQGANVSGAVAYATTANSVAGANVSGQVGNALVAGTVYTNAQPNITSVGTLTALTVNGSVNLGNVANINIAGGSANYVLQTDGTGNLTWTQPGGSGSLTADVDIFTGDGSNASFTLANTPAGENYTMVAVQGVLQPKTSYSLTGKVLTFDSAPPDTSLIEVTTFGGAVVASGSSFIWTIANSNSTMSVNNGYFVDTSSSAKTMTLPTSATLGDTIRINDLAGTFGTNNLTVARNGHKIQGSANDLLVDTDQSSFGLVYSNSTYGWKVLEL